MTEIFVFVGPTLPASEVHAVLPEAAVLPPVRRGDVARLIRENATPGVIGLVDGLFGSVPSVNHKELLFALSEGWTVFGASSMGALRAAELWRFGMQGVGEIFRRYRDGVWDSDDEVAVSHELRDSGYRSSSTSLANIRIALQNMRQQRLISGDAETQLVALAQKRFYAERSWPLLLRDASEAESLRHTVATVRRYLDTAQPDAKRHDALEMLEQLRALTGPSASQAPLRGRAADFDFEPTVYWRRLVSESTPAQVGASPEDLQVDQMELQRHVKLGGERRDVELGALMLHLLEVADRQAGAPLSSEPEDFRAALRRFRRRRGLLTSAALERWRETEWVSDADLVSLVHAELLVERFLARSSSEVRDLLSLELKRRGEFAATLSVVESKNQARAVAGSSSPSVDDLPITFAQLMTWYQEKFESVEGSPAEHARERGYGSERQFISEVIAEYLADDVARG